MIYVTAFKPFGFFNINSSEESLKRANLSDDVKKAFLPVDEKKTKIALANLKIDKEKDIIILFGQSPKNRDVRIEKIAHNKIFIPGIDKVERPIKENGLDYISTLNIEELSLYLKNAGIENTISTDAGSYICNYSYYLMLSEGYQAVFIHLPFIKGQTKDEKIYSLDILTLIRAVELTTRYFEGLHYDN